jgi:L,D-transpeptidase catalytic domain
MSVNRRDVLAGTFSGVVGVFAPFAVAEESGKLKPGEFRWMPEAAPDGPVAVIVSIPDQLVHVYRNGVRIGLSSCSTGKQGHSTPTGIFTILQKDKHHHSSTYNNAPMPNMNRLTWSGIALHAGNLPGYPASHGCIRLPMKFSELLFGVTHIGTPVIVANDHSQPSIVAHPGGILSAIAEAEMEQAVAKLAEKSLPPADRHAAMQHAAAVLVSGADREMYILRDGEIVAKGAVTIREPQAPLGSHVFVLVGPHSDRRSLRWKAVSYSPSKTKLGLNDGDAVILSRLQPAPDMAKRIIELMHPGLVLTLTDLPAHPETRSARDFVVVTQDEHS